MAFAEANVSSLADTLERSVSNTPDFKSATSMFDMLLPVPSTSNVLFVNVSVLEAVMQLLRSGPVIVSVSPLTAVVMLVPPAILNVSPVPSVAPVESSPTNCMLVSTFMPVRLDPSPANAVAVTVPFTCNAVEGSEVPIPTRLLVTSMYSRFVSNARSTPFLVRLDFNTDPDIRPMAILQYSFIIMLVEHMSYTASLSLPADSSIGIYAPKKKGRP